MDIHLLRRQHRSIIDKASLLGGMSRHLRTRGDAQEARDIIDAVDRELVVHLTIEDAELYPLLLKAGDRDVGQLASEVVEGVGGLSEIWVRFRDHWTVSAMTADPARFAFATANMLNVLSARVEIEEDVVYPAVEAVARRGDHSVDAA